MEEIVGFIIIY